MSHKGNKGYLKSIKTEHTVALELITPVSSGGKPGFPEAETLMPLMPWLQPQAGPCHICIMGKHSLCLFDRASEKALEGPGSQ